MKAALFTAAAMLAALPGAALADSATYTAIYSPTLDLTTRSCEITNTGVQGSRNIGQNPSINSNIASDNTAIMRTIGQTEGKAQSTAGIRLDMIGANILTIEDATMVTLDGSGAPSPSTGDGQIKLDLPTAKADLGGKNLTAIGKELGFEYKNERGSTIATMIFDEGQATEEKVGSIVLGKKTNSDDFTGAGRGGTDLIIRKLASSRVNGSRTGTVQFQLNNINEDTPTTLMRATISCEPVPLARNGVTNARISPVRQN